MGSEGATVISSICLMTMLGLCNGLPHLRADERPVVDVTQGRIVGVRETYDDQAVFAFRAIPFAKPPLEELRFMAPQPADPWDGDLDASSQPQPCPQATILGGEDCLYLNVYTPEGAQNGTEKLPVMVFIYGGAFVIGNVGMYDKTYRLVQQGVIVVLIQYRLGVLGFFSTDDDVAPGNQGLMDQTLGLEWVRDNIDAFGGDNQQVTLFGESAGSASTHFQILTPNAAGLFQRAIMESGNAFCPWSVGRDFYTVSRDIADRFDCPLEPSEDLLVCLQGVNFRRLSNMYGDFVEWNFQPFKFAPRVDGSYIPDEPARLVREGLFNKVPTIIGTTRDEGSLISGEMYALRSLIDSLVDNFDTNGPISLELYDDEDPLNTAHSVYDYYLGGVVINDNNADNVTKMYTDRLFHVNLDWLVEESSDQVEVYYYQLDHRGKSSLLHLFNLLGLDIPQADDWVCHADDLPYIFDIAFAMSDPEDDPDDAEVSRIFVETFTNFAKYGNPTPDESTLGFIWSPATSSNIQHLSIDVPPTMAEDSRQDVRTFFENLPLRINAILH